MRFGFSMSYAALWAVVLFQLLVALGLLQRVTELKQWLSETRALTSRGLPSGVLGPAFVAKDLRSGQLITSAARDGRETILLFLSPGCTVCRDLVGGLGTLSSHVRDALVTICDGEESACTNFVRAMAADVPALLDADRTIRGRYDVMGSPTAVLLGADNRVRGYGNPTNIVELDGLMPSGARLLHTARES